jgi:menaquinone-dependent protoporphyrinogen oxidase
LQPALDAAVAGRLDYPSYNWLDRQIIRLIMMLTGGPTDPRCRVEYTSWKAVDAIADRIAAICRDVSDRGGNRKPGDYFSEA